MRLFVAVNFGDTVRAAIRTALEAFPVSRPPWRWAAPETWHVTLKFLGETPPEDVAEIAAALEPVRARHAAFPLALGKFGAFPGLRAPRVLFYGVETGAEAMSALARDVERALVEALGVEPEARAFHAHATVARIKEPLPRPITDLLASVPPLSHPVTRVTSFDLMESRLARTGARYSVLKRFALPGGAC
jgi:2'-5' RNA ligase